MTLDQKIKKAIELYYDGVQVCCLADGDIFSFNLDSLHIYGDQVWATDKNNSRSVKLSDKTGTKWAAIVNTDLTINVW